jgi:hypothetical protein
MSGRERGGAWDGRSAASVIEATSKGWVIFAATTRIASV